MKTTHVYTSEFNSDVLIGNLVETVITGIMNDTHQKYVDSKCVDEYKRCFRVEATLEKVTDEPYQCKVHIWYGSSTDAIRISSDAVYSRESVDTLVFDVMLEGMIKPYHGMEYRLEIEFDEMNYDVVVYIDSHEDDRLIARRTFKMEVEGAN